jgi:hypothetical protein
VFVELLDREHDLDVLDALAAAIARSRWEPTDDGNIVELRRWVAGRHAEEPPAPEAPVAPSGADANPAALDHDPTPPATPEPAPERAPEADPDLRRDSAPEEIAVPADDAPPPLAPVGAVEAAPVAPSDAAPPAAAPSNGSDATRDLEAPAHAGGGQGRPAETTAIVPMATTMMEPMGSTDLSELVPKIRALLGEDLDRMEFVSLEGEVIARWSATDPPPSRAHEDASNPT